MDSQIMPYKIQAHGISDVGHVRHNNEDVWAELPDHFFYVLADGMGGHQAGEVAAEEAVNALCSQIRSMFEPGADAFTFDEAQGAIQLAIENTNTVVFQKSIKSPELNGMGTTLCCLLFHPQGVIFGHVGDSRIYKMRGGYLDPLTRDHSLLREMIERGKTSTNGDDHKRMKNVITRAIGTEPYVEPAVHMTEVSEGDLFLMCTDGLTDMLTDDEISSILSQPFPIDVLSQTLVNEAKEKGGRDNITVVLVLVERL